MIKLRNLSIFIVLLLIIAFTISFTIIGKSQVNDIDTVDVATVTNEVTSNWGANDNVPVSKYKYKVIDLNGKVLIGEQTVNGYKQQLQDAYLSRCIISDVIIDNRLVGKIIFDAESLYSVDKVKITLNATLTALMISLVAIITTYLIYLYYRVHKPFTDMTKFAHTIASGELDIPLIMDRNNIFGAYTESFDIMRAQLKEARQNEQRANIAKKEVVASISHDLNAPLAVIKATCECMEINNSSKHLNLLLTKVNDMETLINDMLMSTLDELCELKVVCTAMQSTQLYNIINYADYNDRIQPYAVPNCKIICDEVRLNQAICNIISNAYKYGGDIIDIRFKLDEEFMTIIIRDNGININIDEISLYTNKYYRGANSDKQKGAGLGLFITKKICELMGGGFNIYVENGFVAEIILKRIE